MDKSPEIVENHVYSISKEDFEIPPKELVTQYKLPDRVTRENFTAFLIYMFAHSRGLEEGDRAISDWLELNNGFDYLTTYNNFLDVGAGRALGSDEKKTSSIGNGQS